MSGTDPIQVLRDYRKGIILIDFDPDMRVVTEDEWDAALAQVEALVWAANHVVYPFDHDPHEIHSAWHGSELAAALAPFKENP